MIAIYRAMGWSLCQIAKKLGRNKSTISRELKRNSRDYSPNKAQAAYHKRRKKFCPRKTLANIDLFDLVKKLFLDLHWSPEQIANRLYAGMFDTAEQRRSQGNREARRKLRHKGKPRRPKGYVSNREKIPISHELTKRPASANERSRFVPSGHD